MVKKYGSFLALNNFSCDIPHGVTGLLGPNGAGKTTFIRSLLGIHPFEGNGHIAFNEYILPKDLVKVKDMIGYQPEVPTKINRISAMRYVTHMCRLAGLPNNAAHQRAFDTLHYVGLEEARYREMDTFSQGMLQKVKLATALVHDPLLLILDEPTAGCDPDSREQILDLIYDLGKNHGKNILISTHLLPDVERTADHIVVMNNGKTIMQGDLETILSHKSESTTIIIRVSGDPTKFATLLENNGYKVLEIGETISITVNKYNPDINLSIFQLAKQNGMYVRMITPYKNSLEDVFLNEIKKQEVIN